jgi:hypothetical protein
VAAAALWLCVIAPLPQPPTAAPPLRPSPAALPAVDVWQLDQLSAPELEGAVDLLPADRTLRISI